jgi:hypothetical protein
LTETLSVSGDTQRARTSVRRVSATTRTSQ